jgi:hypothetical protein
MQVDGDFCGVVVVKLPPNYFFLSAVAFFALSSDPVWLVFVSFFSFCSGSQFLHPDPGRGKKHAHPYASQW